MSLVLTAVWLSIGLTAAFDAEAADFCKSLSDLSGTLDEPDKIADQRFALPEHAAAEAGCRRSLGLSGAKSLHCMWAFAYRSEAANGGFEMLLDRVGGCAEARPIPDQDVNHPDSYDLRWFKHGKSDVSVSLKDKGALQQTLVFLTVSTL